MSTIAYCNNVWTCCLHVLQLGSTLVDQSYWDRHHFVHDLQHVVFGGFYVPYRYGSLKNYRHHCLLYSGFFICLCYLKDKMSKTILTYNFNHITYELRWHAFTVLIAEWPIHGHILLNVVKASTTNKKKEIGTFCTNNWRQYIKEFKCFVGHFAYIDIWTISAYPAPLYSKP